MEKEDFCYEKDPPRIVFDPASVLCLCVGANFGKTATKDGTVEFGA